MADQIQSVRKNEFASCGTCGGKIIHTTLTPEAAQGYDERRGTCSNRHTTIYVIKPGQKVDSKLIDRK